MVVAILPGRIGMRLAEETEVKPEPLVKIGEGPILWRIMNRDGHYGLDELANAVGFNDEYIKTCFVHDCVPNSDLRVGFDLGEVERRGGDNPNRTVELIDAGMARVSRGRIIRLVRCVGDGDHPIRSRSDSCAAL